MNLGKNISISNIFEDLADMFHDFQTDVSRTEMMGVSDNAFLHHSHEMPYRTAHQAFENLKNNIAFKFNDRTRVLTVSSQALEVNRSFRRPKRHVYVFNYIDDIFNHDIFMYNKESGALIRVDHKEAESMLRWLLLTNES